MEKVMHGKHTVLSHIMCDLINTEGDTEKIQILLRIMRQKRKNLPQSIFL